MNVIKRNGSEAIFDISKIEIAIGKANDTVPQTDRMSDEQIKDIASNVQAKCKELGHAAGVEDIQDMVEMSIMKLGFYQIAKNYITYRYERSKVRQKNTIDDKILTIINGENEEAKQENSNKNPIVNSTQRDYMAGEVSKDICKRYIFPKDIIEAHEQGVVHLHDTDYLAQHMHNCDLVNLEDMLQNGTVISGTLIEKPHSFSTACNITTQIIAQVASNQYGGQTFSLAHLAPFVDISRQKIRKKVIEELKDTHSANDTYLIDKITESRLHEEITRGVQMIQYQILTLLTSNGQTPFVTSFMYLGEVNDPQTKADLALIIEETLKQRIQGVKNESGAWITPSFPKLIYVLEEDNITEDSKYWYLTKLAAECTAKRMVPDYISAKVMKELKNGDVYACMGCRSFLTPDTEGFGPNHTHKYYGRFNCGVVTINLVDVGLSAHKDMDEFWKIFDERLELCHRALQIRHKYLRGTLSDVAPILWQYGAIARLKKGETIDKLLYNNYCTISLGYVGLHECVYAMTGKSHMDPDNLEFSLAIMQHMNDKCAEWRTAENISYSLYGTPMESTTYKFAKCLKNRFGVVPGVTDHNYITNSYHFRVTEEVDAFTKLAKEAQFQKLSPGGAISYIEVPDMKGNIPAVLNVIKFIYDNIMYAELNTKSDYCQECGWDGEIDIVTDDNGKLIWKCPKCGNTNQSTMNIARRTCGLA